MLNETERRLASKVRNDLGRVIPASKSEIFDLKDRQARFLEALVEHGGINYARQLIQVPEDLFNEWMQDPGFKRRVEENIRGVLERYIEEVAETGKRKPEDIIKRENRGMVGALNNNREAYKSAFYMMITLYPEIVKRDKDVIGMGNIIDNRSIINVFSSDPEGQRALTTIARFMEGRAGLLSGKTEPG